MVERSPMAALAARSHPRALKDFALSLLPGQAGPAAEITADFQLSCPKCGGAIFELYSHPLVVPNPSPYHLVNPGETLYRPPHSAECVRCGHHASIFDARTDGLDGVLNGGCAYESGLDGKARFPAELKLRVSLTYNVEPEDVHELHEMAAEAEVAPADLFDWIAIVGTTADGGAVFSVDYECA